MCQVSSLTPLFLPQNKLDGGLGIWVKIWTKECCLSGCTKQIIQRIDDVGLYFNPQTDQPSEKHAALRIIHMVVLKPAEITFSTRQLRGIFVYINHGIPGEGLLIFRHSERGMTRSWQVIVEKWVNPFRTEAKCWIFTFILGRLVNVPSPKTALTNREAMHGRPQLGMADRFCCHRRGWRAVAACGEVSSLCLLTAYRNIHQGLEEYPSSRFSTSLLFWIFLPEDLTMPWHFAGHLNSSRLGYQS